MKKLVYFHLLLLLIKTAYFNNNYFHVLTFQTTMYDFQFQMQVQLSNVHRAYC